MSIWVRDTDEYRRALAEERLVVAASELTSEALERRGRTRTWLAERLGVRLPEISQRLSGRRNLTLRSFAVMLHELDYDVALSLVDRRSVVTGATASGFQGDPEATLALGDEAAASLDLAAHPGREGLDELLTSWEAETPVPVGIQRQVAAELDEAGLPPLTEGGASAAR